MIEPTLALQTAIRSALLSSPAIASRVAKENVRSGSSRPENAPCIIMSDGVTTLHGHSYRSQRLAWVYLDLHIWTRVDGQEAAKNLSFTVQQALDGPLDIEGGACDHFQITRAIYPRDPDPDYGHGVLSVEALLRWTV